MSTWLLQGRISCLADEEKREWTFERQRLIVPRYFFLFIIHQHVTRLLFFSRFVQWHPPSLVILQSRWPHLLALYMCPRLSQDKFTNHSDIIQQVSKASLGKLPRYRSEELCFGWLKKQELVSMSSTEPKSIAAGVLNLYKIIIDSHCVIISSNHETGPSASGIMLTCNYINFLVKCWILEILFIHKECRPWFCLCITDSS